MSTDQLMLYDLPTKPPCRAWSYNPWKTRLLLNYKGIDYKTEWVEYPDIEAKFDGHVIPNDQPGGTRFTIPVVQFPNGTYVRDSFEIAKVIEATHPEPPVYLDSPNVEKLTKLVTSLRIATFACFVAKMPKRILNDAAHEYWYETRKPKSGMSMDEYEMAKGGEGAFEAAEPALREVTALFKQNTEGPFLMGKTVSYADFVWVSFLAFFQTIGDDLLGPLLNKTGDREIHLRLLEAARPYLERNDH